MRDTRLIFVEGLTGSGKSTTSQRLWLHLERCGLPARWIYEHDTSHPIWAPDESQRLAQRDALPPGFIARTLPRRWARLARQCAADGKCTIMESALLQSTVALMLAMNVDEPAIVAGVLACERAAAPLKPVLVWLWPGDVAQALRTVCDERREDNFEQSLIALLDATPYGRAQGVSDFSGVVGFFERWARIAQLLCERLSMPVLTVNAPDWQARERQICSFLALPPIEELHERIDTPSRFIGRFGDTVSDDRLAIVGGDEGLYLGESRRNRLVVRRGDTFLVAALCLEVSFEDERDGRFHRMRLRGNLPGLSPTWQRVNEEDARDGR